MKFTTALLIGTVSATVMKSKDLSPCEGTEKKCKETGYVCCSYDAISGGADDVKAVADKCFKDGKDGLKLKYTDTADGSGVGSEVTLKMCTAASGAMSTKAGFTVVAMVAAYFMA